MGFPKLGSLIGALTMKEFYYLGIYTNVVLGVPMAFWA